MQSFRGGVVGPRLQGIEQIPLGNEGRRQGQGRPTANRPEG